MSISIVIVLVITTHYIGWLSSVENFFTNLITPGSKLMYSISVEANEKEQFESVDELWTAYEELKDKLIDNEVNQVQMKLVSQENIELKEQLNFIQEKKYTSIGAEVIGKNLDPIENTLILNRGVNDNIEVGQPVIVANGILIGKIVKVEDKLSVVRLINDNQSRIASTIMNQDKSIGLIEGGYGISVHMNFIPQNETIQIGDMIVTSGLEQELPKGLLIGKIEAIEKEAYQPFQKAVIAPSTNLDKITLVSILLTRP